MGQPWVPLPALAAIETAPALGSLRLSLGSQRREVCSGGTGVRPRSGFSSSTSACPCKGRRPATAQGHLRNHPGKQSRRLQSLNLGRSLGLRELLRRQVSGSHPRLIDLGVVVLNTCIFHVHPVSPKALGVKSIYLSVSFWSLSHQACLTTCVHPHVFLPGSSVGLSLSPRRTSGVSLFCTRLLQSNDHCPQPG